MAFESVIRIEFLNAVGLGELETWAPVEAVPDLVVQMEAAQEWKNIDAPGGGFGRLEIILR